MFLKINFLLHKLVCVKLAEGLVAYPLEEACFSVNKIVIYISVVNQPLDCFQPITLDVRPAFNIFQLLFPIRHRTTNAADTVVALIVKLAMRNAVSVQELPHVALRPMNDWRHENLVLAPPHKPPFSPRARSIGRMIVPYASL